MLQYLKILRSFARRMEDYIRTKDYFVKKNKLRYFFKDPVTMSNVAYSLQMSDLYN